MNPPDRSATDGLLQSLPGPVRASPVFGFWPLGREGGFASSRGDRSMHPLGSASSVSLKPVTPPSGQVASIARGEITSPRVTVGSPGAPGLPSAGALLQQAVEDDPLQPGLVGRRAQTVLQSAGFESLKDIQRQDAARARSGLVGLKRAAREGGGADAGQARMKIDLFLFSSRLGYASGPGRLSDRSETGLASVLAALQPQKEGDRAASAADVACVVMAFVHAEGGPDFGEIFDVCLGR